MRAPRSTADESHLSSSCQSQHLVTQNAAVDLQIFGLSSRVLPEAVWPQGSGTASSLINVAVYLLSGTERGYVIDRSAQTPVEETCCLQRTPPK